MFPLFPPPRTALFTFFLFALAGCSFLPQRSSSAEASRGRLITRAEIERSGARDAWEVLRRAGTHLRMSETKTGRPTGVLRRGRTSLHLNDRPALLVDGVRIDDLDLLRGIPATNIYSIRILNAIDATVTQGTNAVGGAIIIRTRNGPEE